MSNIQSLFQSSIITKTWWLVSKIKHVGDNATSQSSSWKDGSQFIIIWYFFQTNGAKANGDSNGDKNGHEGEKSKNSTVDNGNVVRISTRQWAIDSGYDPKLIFQKLFHDDIKYLLSMDKLWAKRRPPVPLDWENLPGPKSDVLEIGLIRDQQMWNIYHCVEIFADSVKKLSEKFKVSLNFTKMLMWFLRLRCTSSLTHVPFLYLSLKIDT